MTTCFKVNFRRVDVWLSADALVFEFVLVSIGKNNPEHPVEEFQ